MKLPSAFPRLEGVRFARDVIAYPVWTYHRFALSAAVWKTCLPSVA